MTPDSDIRSAISTVVLHAIITQPNQTVPIRVIEADAEIAVQYADALIAALAKRNP